MYKLQNLHQLQYAELLFFIKNDGYEYPTLRQSGFGIGQLDLTLSKTSLFQRFNIFPSSFYPLLYFSKHPASAAKGQNLALVKASKFEFTSNAEWLKRISLLTGPIPPSLKSSENNSSVSLTLKGITRFHVIM